MAGLTVLRASIALWKRVIAISDLLKPSTWRAIAITQAVLAVSLFGLYFTQETNEPHIPPVSLTDIRPSLPREVDSAQVAVNSPNFDIAFDAKSFDLGTEAVYFDIVGRTDMSFSKSVVVTEHSSLMVIAAHEWAPSSGMTNHLSVSEVRSVYPTTSADTPTVVIQMPPPARMSLLQTAQAIMLLVQAFFMTIGSIFTSVFAWVAYHRGKADAIMKDLLIRELRLKLEKLEREREAQDVPNSPIIVCPA